MIMSHKEIAVELRGDAQQVAVIRLMRSTKRNALSDGLVLGLRDVFMNLPASVRAAVVDGDGPHFCAGLDLSELSERDAAQGVLHSRMCSLVRCRWWLPCMVRWWVEAWSWPAPVISVWLTAALSMLCPKAREEFLWAAVVRYASRA